VSAGDALYSLQMLLRGGDVRLDRVVAGAAFLDGMLEKGLDDSLVDDAATLLHAFVLTLAASTLGEERQRVRRLVEHLARYANPVKGA